MKTDYIMACAINEVNSIPLVKNEKYIFLAPKDVVNPYFEITVKDVEGDLLSKYYEKLKNYLKLMARLRFEIFVCKVKKKRVVNHKLPNQSQDKPRKNDFVLIRDSKKYN